MKPPHEWKYKESLPIHDRMIDVVKKTKEAAEFELTSARKKLRKLQYGS